MGPFLVADITEDLGSADQPAGFVSQWSDRHGRIDPLSTLGHANCLEMHPLAGFHFLENLVLLLPAFLRDEHRHGLSNGFRCRESKYVFRRSVPTLNEAVQILRHDRLVGRVDDGGKAETCVNGCLVAKEPLTVIGSAALSVLRRVGRLRAIRSRNPCRYLSFSSTDNSSKPGGGNGTA